MALKNLTKYSLIHYLRSPFTPLLDLVKFTPNHVIPSLNLTLRVCTCFFQVVVSESRNEPFILFMKDAEKSIVGNGDPLSFKKRLENLPDNVVVIGSHTHTDSRKDKVIIVCFCNAKMV